jgi:hypothetical protein
MEVIENAIFSGAEDRADRDAEDTDAATVPDFFDKLRPVVTTGEPDFQPNVAVKCTILCACIFCFSMFVSAAYALAYSTDFWGLAVDRPQLFAVEDVCRGLAYLVMTALPLEFIRAIHPRDGALAKLNAGNQRVSEHAMRSLQRWRTVLACAGGVLFVGGFGLFAISAHGVFTGTTDFNIDGVEDGFSLWSIAILFGLCGSFIGWALVAAWFFSMKVAARLAEDNVLEVSKRTTVKAAASDVQWYEEVFQPAGQLSKETMQVLSRGWGTGTAACALICWLYSTSKFARWLALESNPAYLEAFGRLASYVRILVPAVLISLAPALLAMDLAKVSSLCDTLMNKINGLSLEASSVEHAEEINRHTQPLLHTLKSLRGGQGLGFAVRAT